MSARIKKVMFSIGSIVASFVLTVAIASVGQGCWYLGHQPDIPEELKK